MLRGSIMRSSRMAIRGMRRTTSAMNRITNIKSNVLNNTIKVNKSSFTSFTTVDHESLAASETNLAARVTAMCRAFQVSGHHLADLDPLKLGPAGLSQDTHPELDIKNYNFSEQDLDRTDIDFGVDLIEGFLSPDQPKPFSIRELISCLQRTYCGSIGVEYMYMSNADHVNWIRKKLETREPPKYSNEEKKQVWRRLAYSDMFETTLSNKFPQAKRFGLEGCESMIPGLKALIDRSAHVGVDAFVIGLAHRGRLNVLSNVLRKPLELIFAEFGGGLDIGEQGSGDVKYHLGMFTTRELPTGKKVELSLLPNPSHLETVNPVVIGKVRAKQFYGKDTTKDKNMSILIHGDAAFAGQGIVYETFGFSDLHDYTTGGTIHIIINNQIGFTTNPRQSRSSPYTTDVAKYISAPIFHVNGDDPEAVVFVCQLASEYRQKFKKDVVVDIICYRRRGHNELENPSFTQPQMYKKIATHNPTLQLYTEQLIKEGVFESKSDADQSLDAIKKVFEEAFAKSKNVSKGNKEGKEDATGDSLEILKIMNREWSKKEQPWIDMIDARELSPIRDTGLPHDKLVELGMGISQYPDTLNIHSGVKRVMDQRRIMVTQDGEVDWGCAEQLAFASLLDEKFHVRLSGQDVERGTFSHRHSVLVDQESEQKYIPLQHLNNHQAEFHVSNSHLSEYGVLGFELGYSYESPNALVIWEAQFGDFANGAQIIIDQYLASAEQKWLRSSGLVMLLPHGYEGQGPEHSNARMERFLQLNDEKPDVIPEMARDKRRQIQMNNWQIVNCSTPANYFHVLRRQLHRSFRKPLVIFTPKSLLRTQKVKIDGQEFKLAVSPLKDMERGSRFKRLIGENQKDEKDWLLSGDQIKRIVFCTGKVYYDLWKHRRENNIKNVAIVRVEQIAPFPFDLVEEQMQKYPNALVSWCQEEPRNYGAAAYFYFRARTVLKKLNAQGARKEVQVFARKQAASPATGFKYIHDSEQEELCREALSL
ncbi:2-oxoglutarate dehydrogenase E1 component [Acrasis kona]|uniref:2-oxoglutarate dehydrogenase, mitochondrial n=1 Tax=Acrasis kona TaxID=1008807 RepID=A0AAW2YXZ7_9EUKA